MHPFIIVATYSFRNHKLQVRYYIIQYLRDPFHPPRECINNSLDFYLFKNNIGNTSLGLFSHVTRFRLLNGVLDHEMDLTPGGYWVHDIHGVSVVKRAVYFTASPPGEPSQKHLYEVSLVNRDAPGEPKCVSCQFKSPEGINDIKYTKKKIDQYLCI